MQLINALGALKADYESVLIEPTGLALLLYQVSCKKPFFGGGGGGGLTTRRHLAVSTCKTFIVWWVVWLQKYFGNGHVAPVKVFAPMIPSSKWPSVDQNSHHTKYSILFEKGK